MPQLFEEFVRTELERIADELQLVKATVLGDARIGFGGVQAKVANIELSIHTIEVAQATMREERMAWVNQARGVRMAFAALGVTNVTTLIGLVLLLLKVFGGP